MLQPIESLARQPEPAPQAPGAAYEAPASPKPAERPRPEPVRFRFDPELERPAEVVQPSVREPVPSRRQLPVANWLVVGLAFVCILESLIIAGLLASRATVTVAAPGRSESATTTAAASEKPRATPAAPAVTPPAPQVTAQVPPPSSAPKPAPTPPPVTLTRGWLTIESQFEMQIFEGNTLLGTTRSERLSLMAGPHELRLVNTSLNFETTVNVEIPAGVGITTRIATPNGTLSLNAVPWANVSLDGKSLGTTPVMNLSVPVGSHEITWRHPQLGERRQTVVVTARGPVSVVRDLRR